MFARTTIRTLRDWVSRHLSVLVEFSHWCEEMRVVKKRERNGVLRIAENGIFEMTRGQSIFVDAGGCC